MLRREFLAGTVALAAAPSTIGAGQSGGGMYGLIGRMLAAPGKSAELIASLLESTGDMPGCLSYIVAEDVGNPQAIWVTEVWDSKTSHDASLSLPAVRAAIAKAKPIIAGFDSQAETVPLGGYGLKAAGR